jgi:DNA modification methylase
MQWQLDQGDALEVLKGYPSEAVHCVVTSPPYWGLRDYGDEGQLGMEPTPDEYINHLVDIFREVRRVLRKDGTLWLNLGDSYAGSGRGMNGDGTAGVMRSGKQISNHGSIVSLGEKKHLVDAGLPRKNLVGIPWRVALALQADGWILRSDIIWSKPNPMPESVKDRPTRAHEYIFLFAKSQRYYYDAHAIAEPAKCPEDDLRRIRAQHEGNKSVATAQRNGLRKRGRSMESIQIGRNKRTVWTVTPAQYREAHFATYPPRLIEPCILAGSPEGGTVLDPFAGSGTTLLTSLRLGRNAVGIELNPEYVEIACRRIYNDAPLLNPRGTLFGGAS